jgi:DNA-binding NtrC family response regulator
MNLPDAIRVPLLAAPQPPGPGSPSGLLVPDDLSLHTSVARLERTLILQALEQAKGNRSAAARLLGIGRPLLYAKLEEHGIGGRGEEASEGDGDSTPPES